MELLYLWEDEWETRERYRKTRNTNKHTHRSNAFGCTALTHITLFHLLIIYYRWTLSADIIFTLKLSMHGFTSIVSRSRVPIQLRVNFSTAPERGKNEENKNWKLVARIYINIYCIAIMLALCQCALCVRWRSDNTKQHKTPFYSNYELNLGCVLTVKYSNYYYCYFSAVLPMNSFSITVFPFSIFMVAEWVCVFVWLLSCACVGTYVNIYWSYINFKMCDYDIWTDYVCKRKFFFFQRVYLRRGQPTSRSIPLQKHDDDDEKWRVFSFTSGRMFIASHHTASRAHSHTRERNAQENDQRILLFRFIDEKQRVKF